jgi:hypothetical protein
LPQVTNADIAKRPIGGGDDEIQVSLDDGNWDAASWALFATDQQTLDRCQTVIADFVEVSAPD